jgi:hypothetical protein
LGECRDVDLNIKAQSIEFNRPLVQIPALIVLVIVLNSWVWTGAHLSGANPYAISVRYADLVTATAVGLESLFVAPWVMVQEALPLEARWAALFVSKWPLHGPFASMATGRLGLPLPDMPHNTTLLEPVAYASALLPALCLTPLIIGGYQNKVANWFIFLARAPLVIIAISVTTIPIMVLNGIIADRIAASLVTAAVVPWIPMLGLAVIFYVQIAMIGAIIGECFRRILILVGRRSALSSRSVREFGATCGKSWENERVFSASRLNECPAEEGITTRL